MEFREIGSNFYTCNFKLASYVDDHILKSKYNLTRNIVYPSLGRNAISVVLKELKVNKKIALLPGYTCETVIAPFISENYELVFYSFYKDLSINLDDLKSKIADFNPGIILVHGFYGYNTFLSAKSLIQSARKDGCIVIEDDTQTVFSEIETLSADYYLGSIRKWMEIPDGAFICSSESPLNISNSINNTYIDLLTEAFILKADYVNNLDKNQKLRYKKLYLKAQSLIDNDPAIYRMSDLSMGILNNYDVTLMRRNRIENFNYLLENILNKFESLHPVFSTPVTYNICPYYFPLFVNNRKKFQGVLSQNDIYVTIIWPKSDLIKSLNKETEFIYDKIIGIPCDQRYNKKDMQRIISVMNKFFN
jgi:dTDP-4-amino-4,6-dideoxygalactose transaminase